MPGLVRPSGPTGPFAAAWRRSRRFTPGTNGGDLYFILAYSTVTGWLVADGWGRWADLPATWAGWTEWNHRPKSPILYTHRIDVGVKVKFTPLVTVVVDGTAVVEEQHSDNNVTFSGWATVGPQIDARYVNIRVTVSGTYPKIKSQRIILAASPTVEYIEDQSSLALVGAYRIGVGDIRVPITKVYSVIKKVDITLQSVGPGWSVELIDKDVVVGPRIKIYNSSNVLADATFDATVSGIKV